MNTEYFRIDKNNIDLSTIDYCATLLRENKLVVFPTETVYGLGANALNLDAIKSIFDAKNRPSDNPLILHVDSLETALKYIKNVKPIAFELAKHFMPGPLSLIFEKSDIVPYEATGNLETVAIRIPKNPIAYELIKRSKLPIAAPSANTSGKPSPTEGKHVLEDLNKKVHAIIDGGKCDIGVESTVLDLTQDIPTVLRPGGTSIESLKKYIPNLKLAYNSNNKSAPKAPGMKYTHYSPSAPLTIIKGESDKVAAYINSISKSSTGILCTIETKHLYKKGQIVCVGSIKNPKEIASNLFNCLRTFNSYKVSEIYSEFFDSGDLSHAIINRLTKAATNTINL